MGSEDWETWGEDVWGLDSDLCTCNLPTRRLVQDGRTSVSDYPRRTNTRDKGFTLVVELEVKVETHPVGDV